MGKSFSILPPRAVGNLELANDEVRFNARFGGGTTQRVCPAGCGTRHLRP
ncbi:ClpXP protease specificity-enhancing factor / Stringent starvation protein B [Klebsiella pneumoniae]|nr:ClpXP protease specificity-enhancing factor / Stringent starvation protein B [Klebsiella pneumoniae]